jgi:hypothetical protein
LLSGTRDKGAKIFAFRLGKFHFCNHHSLSISSHNAPRNFDQVLIALSERMVKRDSKLIDNARLVRPSSALVTTVNASQGLAFG